MATTRSDEHDEPTFRSLGVTDEVARALQMRGIERPFAIQSLVLPDALAGRDVLARSRTGSGKTLAFAVPMVERLPPSGKSPTGLILAPTRELASQVTEEFRAIADVRRLQIASVYGGVGIGPQAKRARHADIVIATPGRLLDLVARKLLRLDRVRACVLDEADRMLDMGFLPDVTRILQMLRPDRQTMLFSATLDGEVGRLATRFTRDPVLHESGEAGPTSSTRPIASSGWSIPTSHRALVRELAADRGLALIFVRTQRGADRVARNLPRKASAPVSCTEACPSPSANAPWAVSRAARTTSSSRPTSRRAASTWNDITHVINFDAPADDKAYVHRVGRTARAGRGGEGVTFVTPDQRLDVGRIAKRLHLHAEFERAGLSRSPAPGSSARKPGSHGSPKGGNTHRRRQARNGASVGRRRQTR